MKFIPQGRSIGSRITGVFAATLMIALAGSGYGVYSLNQVAARTQSLINDSVATERLVADWYRNVMVSIRRTTAVAVSTDASLADFFAPEMADMSKDTSRIQEQLAPLMQRAEEKRAFAEVADVRKGYVAARDAVFSLKNSGDAAAARKMLDEQYLPASLKYQAVLRDMASAQRREIDASGDAVQTANRHAQVALVAFSIASLLMGGLLSWWLVRGITRQIRRAVQAAGRIARFDLTDRIECHDRDELGRLLNALAGMQGALRTLVSGVRASTDRISTASAEIADGSLDLSSRTEQAAASLEQTAASVEQMHATVQESAQGARTASGLASASAEVATRGGAVVAQVVATMEDIDRSSRRIADITGVIDGIAFQTNILALNAAVEAARAGEQGRGFAVVATEVRLLAQRSAEAAKEIKSLIGASVDRVEAGTRLAADAGSTMNDVVASAERVSRIIGEITAAADEQSHGIGQVNTAVSQLDQVTQRNAALVEESAAAAESLKVQSSQLAEMVQQFRL